MKTRKIPSKILNLNSKHPNTSKLLPRPNQPKILKLLKLKWCHLWWVWCPPWADKCHLWCRCQVPPDLINQWPKQSTCKWCNTPCICNNNNLLCINRWSLLNSKAQELKVQTPPLKEANNHLWYPTCKCSKECSKWPHHNLWIKVTSWLPVLNLRATRLVPARADKVNIEFEHWSTFHNRAH